MWQRATSGAGGGGGTGNALMVFTISASGVSANHYVDEDLLTYVSGNYFGANGQGDISFTSNVSGKIDIFCSNGDSSGTTYVKVNDTIVCQVTNTPYVKNVTDIPISAGDTIRIFSNAYYGDVVISYHS